jgi:hypothetical protein
LRQCVEDDSANDTRGFGLSPFGQGVRLVPNVPVVDAPLSTLAAVIAPIVTSATKPQCMIALVFGWACHWQREIS